MGKINQISIFVNKNIVTIIQVVHIIYFVCDPNIPLKGKLSQNLYFGTMLCQEPDYNGVLSPL